MKKVMFALLFLSSTLLFGIDSNQTLTRTQFEDLVIQQGNVTLNNFTIGEQKSWLSNTMTTIRISFSARSRTASTKHFVMMVVGTDASGNNLWSMALEPMMGILSENTTDEVSDSIYCTPGLLNKTQKIWYRVIGDF